MAIKAFRRNGHTHIRRCMTTRPCSLCGNSIARGTAIVRVGNQVFGYHPKCAIIMLKQNMELDRQRLATLSSEISRYNAKMKAMPHPIDEFGRELDAEDVANGIEVAGPHTFFTH